MFIKYYDKLFPDLDIFIDKNSFIALKIIGLIDHINYLEETNKELSEIMRFEINLMEYIYKKIIFPNISYMSLLKNINDIEEISYKDGKKDKIKEIINILSLNDYLL